MSIEKCMPVSLQRVSENQYFGCPVCDKPAINISPDKSGGYQTWMRSGDTPDFENHWFTRNRNQRFWDAVVLYGQCKGCAEHFWVVQMWMAPTVATNSILADWGPESEIQFFDQFNCVGRFERNHIASYCKPVKDGFQKWLFSEVLSPYGVLHQHTTYPYRGGAWGEWADGGPIRNRWTHNAKIQCDQEPVSSPFGFAGKLFAKNFERLSYLADNSDGGWHD